MGDERVYTLTVTDKERDALFDALGAQHEWYDGVMTPEEEAAADSAHRKLMEAVPQ